MATRTTSKPASQTTTSKPGKAPAGKLTGKTTSSRDTTAPRQFASKTTSKANPPRQASTPDHAMTGAGQVAPPPGPAATTPSRNAFTGGPGGKGVRLDRFVRLRDGISTLFIWEPCSSG